MTFKLLFDKIIIIPLKILQSDRKKIISNLIKVPESQKRFFWAREIKFLKDLMIIYPNVSFWLNLNFQKKYDSLVFLKGEYGKKVLKKKYLEFNYKIKSEDGIKLSDKYGQDIYVPKKQKTIKDFLKNE